jgi:outer membrane autotransporter protein
MLIGLRPTKVDGPQCRVQAAVIVARTRPLNQTSGALIMTNDRPRQRQWSIARSAALGSAIALVCAGAQAAVVFKVDFSEVALFTTDPTIQGIAFSAGDPASFEDTFVDDSATPTDPYLVAGLEGSGGIDLPAYNATSFVHAAMPGAQGGGGSAATVEVDAAFLFPLPSGETLRMEALLGGSVQGATEVTTSTSAVERLVLALGSLSFDSLMFYVPADFGGVFRIDNLIIDILGGPPSGGCGDHTASEVTGAEVCVEGGELTFDKSTTVGADVDVGNVGGTVDTAGVDGELSGTIFGTGGLTKIGLGNLVLSGNNTFTGNTEIQRGILTVNGSLQSPVFVGLDGMLRGTGRINGRTRVAGTLAPGNSPGTLTFGAPVSMDPTGRLLIEIDGAGTGNGAGNYSRVIVQGVGNTFTANGTLQPQLRGISASPTSAAPTNDFTPSIGQSFAIVEAVGGVDGTFTALAQPTGLAGGTRFDALYDANAIRLVLTPSDYANLPNTALKGNASAAGGAIQSGRPAPHARKDDLYRSLAILNEQELALALHQLGGEIHADMISAGFEAHRLNRDTIIGRLNDLRLGRFAPSASGQVDPNQHFWLQARGGWLDADGDKNAADFDQTLWGLMGGVDMPINPSLRLGAAIGYVENDVDANAMGEGNTDSVQLVGYGLWEDGGKFANFAVGYGWDSYDTKRRINFREPSALRSSTDGYSLFLDAEGGMRIDQNGYFIEPTLGVRGDILRRDGFAERGGIGALSVEADTYQAIQTRLGAMIERPFETAAGQLVPQLRAYWLHDFGDSIAPSSEATLSGQRFSVDASDVGRDALALGVGLTMEANENLSVFIDYDFTYRSEQTGHGLVAGIQMRW